MRKLGFGIIGTGAIAAVHAAALEASGNARLVAVYDRDGERASAFAHRYRVAAYATLDAFLADSAVEAVSIATPSGLHRDVAVPAARAGKHILCEKPLETTLEKSDEIIRACQEGNVVLSSVFQTRFARAVKAVRRAIDAGRFGVPVLASADVRWYRAPEYYLSASWRGTWALDGGGALMNQAIHTIDLLLYFNGEVESVHGRVTNRLHTQIEVEDTAVAVVRFANGSLGTIAASTACAPGFPRRVELSGTLGTAAIEGDRIVRWQFARELPEDAAIRVECAEPEGMQGGSGGAMQISDEGHRRQIVEFADAILNGRSATLSGADGRRAVELITGIYTSSRTGGPVYFSKEEGR